jgi:hypothetical protein
MSIDELKAAYRRRHGGPDEAPSRVPVEALAGAVASHRTAARSPSRPSLAVPADVAAAVALGLTPRQAEIYAHIFEHARRYGYQPSLRDLMDQFEIRSLNGIRTHIVGLIRKGWIHETEGGMRSLRFRRTPTGSDFRGFILPKE